MLSHGAYHHSKKGAPLGRSLENPSKGDWLVISGQGPGELRGPGATGFGKGCTGGSTPQGAVPGG
jgi:hypothetical protein